MKGKYGNRNISKMMAQYNVLRAAIRAEGTPAIQDAFDKVEEWASYLMTKPLIGERDEQHH